LLAASFGHVSIVRALLDAGARVDATSTNGNTALICAASYNTSTCPLPPSIAPAPTDLHAGTEIVRMLLAAGASVKAADKRGCTALSWAATYGHSDVVPALVDAGADVNVTNIDGDTPLILAAQAGNAFPSMRSQPPVVSFPFDGNFRSSNTSSSVRCGDAHAVVMATLLNAGAAVNAENSDSCTALLAAARNGQAHMVGMLVDAGAHVNHAQLLYAPCGKPRERDETALMAAATYGHTDVVTKLLATLYKGAAEDPAGIVDLEALNSDQETALLLAVTWGHTACAALLLSAGANVHVVSKGTGCFTRAAKTGREDLLTLVLSHGV
jgi:ankyrin repeat protein